MKGYNHLGALVGTRHDLGAFRRFLPQRARDLLLKQAEIIELEAEMQRIYKRDDDSSGCRATFSGWVSQAKEAQNDPSDGLQWRMALELRQALKEHG